MIKMMCEWRVGLGWNRASKIKWDHQEWNECTKMMHANEKHALEWNSNAYAVTLHCVLSIEVPTANDDMQRWWCLSRCLLADCRNETHLSRDICSLLSGARNEKGDPTSATLLLVNAWPPLHVLSLTLQFPLSCRVISESPRIYFRTRTSFVLFCEGAVTV